MLLFTTGVTQVLISPFRAQHRETPNRLDFQGQYPFPQDPRQVPSTGASGYHQRRMAPAVYRDGFNAMFGIGRLSAREIRKLVFDQIETRSNRRILSSMVGSGDSFLIMISS